MSYRAHRAPSAHTDWCARDHRCNLREHRSEEIVVDLPGYGRAVLTRVLGTDGREQAEVRMRLALGPDEHTARWQLRTVLAGLRDLVTLVARPLAARRKEQSMKTPLCANCGDPAQWWDGNCRAQLCGTCVPVRDEYVVALHHIRTGAASRRIRPGRPSTPNAQARPVRVLDAAAKGGAR